MGGQSWRGLSPIITPRRLRGLPAPGNRGEARPGTPAPATFRLLGDPPQASQRHSAFRVATCPAPSQPGSAGPAAARRRVPPRKALHRRLTCRLLHLQCHPDTAPSWGMKAPASRPARPQHSRAGDLLSRPPPPPRSDLRLRRLRGLVSRGAACSDNGREREPARAPVLSRIRPCGRRVA